MKYLIINNDCSIHIRDKNSMICPICHEKFSNQADTLNETDDFEVNRIKISCGHICKYNWRTGVFFRFENENNCIWNAEDLCAINRKCEYQTTQLECPEYQEE